MAPAASAAGKVVTTLSPLRPAPANAAVKADAATASADRATRTDAASNRSSKTGLHHGGTEDTEKDNNGASGGTTNDERCYAYRTRRTIPSLGLATLKLISRQVRLPLNRR